MKLSLRMETQNSNAQAISSFEGAFLFQIMSNKEAAGKTLMEDAKDFTEIHIVVPWLNA